MNPTNKEIDVSRVLCLLGELEGKSWTKEWWDGYHPEVYNKGTVDLNELVNTLCKKLQKTDVTKYSLELQIWWRDHKAADKLRVQKELNEKKTAATKAAAVSKLTLYERKLLGIK